MISHCSSPCIYKCRTPECDGTLKPDGHTKVRWSALNPDGLACESPMVRVQSPKSDGSNCSHKNTNIVSVIYIICLYASR